MRLKAETFSLTSYSENFWIKFKQMQEKSAAIKLQHNVMTHCHRVMDTVPGILQEVDSFGEAERKYEDDR